MIAEIYMIGGCGVLVFIIIQEFRRKRHAKEVDKHGKRR